ncbi:MAG TPA: sigma-54 dependent transcriptional regulator [Candidatus Methylomirabilis sp.]|jgi:DNA-binding NtrC family response regulator|nr:sigma-54 dependent transcriptional regulator [Candidatus Methylomirabilis sp.]
MAEAARILVVDDEPDMVETVARILTRLGHESVTATDGRAALAALEREQPDLVLTDLRMPGMDGLEVLKEVKRVIPQAPVVLFTAHATIETAVEAIKAGAFDYITKPFTADQLQVVIERALTQRRLQEENRRLKEQLQESYRFENIIGRSLPMLQVFEVIKKVARSEANVLIVGESGTGKELVARSIHVNSARVAKPFVPVDCASLPENLLESELFGHEKGAFTGAHMTRPGLFEYANGGTVFLDEVGDLGGNLQAKLLRVLQERQIRRVGGNRLIPVDVRVISATNRDLEEVVKRAEFREDLFYRLNVISIPLPPLRERKGDVPLIAHHYLRKYVASSGKRITGIAPETLALLESHGWPGNVRELQNVIERAVVLAEHEGLLPEDLPEHIRVREAGAVAAESRPDLPMKRAKDEWTRTFEKEYLRSLLKQHAGNISQAARAAGVDRKTIHRLLKKHGLDAS